MHIQQQRRRRQRALIIFFHHEDPEKRAQTAAQKILLVQRFGGAGPPSRRLAHREGGPRARNNGGRRLGWCAAVDANVARGAGIPKKFDPARVFCSHSLLQRPCTQVSFATQLSGGQRAAVARREVLLFSTGAAAMAASSFPHVPKMYPDTPLA